jgi:hypothetical protein
VNKNAFTSLHLYKFCKFIYTHRPFVERISQRTNVDVFTKYSKFVTSYPKDILGHSINSRYVAVNLMNHHTVEVRIFQSTLNINYFMKNIEFCDSLYYFTKNNSAQNNDLGKYKKFVKEYESTYPNLYNFISGLQNL